MRKRVKDMGDKQRKAVMAKLHEGGGKGGEPFKSDKQRRGFFSKVEQVKKSDTRSEHAKAIDRSKQAEKTYPFTEKGIKKWKRNPDQTDLKYVDTPRIIRELKELKKKRQVVRKEITEEKKVIQREDKQIKEKVREHRQVVKGKPLRRKTPEFHKLTGVEKLNLYKIADKYNVDRDLIDFQAYIDPTLTYHENKALLEEHISRIGSKQDMEDKSEEYDSKFNEYLDELKYRAEVTEEVEEKREIMEEYATLRGLEPIPA